MIGFGGGLRYQTKAWRPQTAGRIWVTTSIGVCLLKGLWESTYGERALESRLDLGRSEEVLKACTQ